MAQTRRNTRAANRTTRAKRTPTTSNKTVTFVLDTDQELLTAIDQFVANSDFASFSDFCKVAAQQYLQQATTVTSDQEAAAQGETQDLKLRVAALEKRLQDLTNDHFRLNTLEGDVTKLIERVDRLTEEGEQDAPTPSSKPASKRVAADPVLARLGHLLEDF